ncbi:hypothetical protein IQ266_19010 [filamentous cyanobacterium LEGE 11480]|uniref:Uncharacterized protein n=1 Tax=Romeriopsis navalis LEGE 11480 TaxID=2777977 RepID=A0A928VTA1_9CYAN|nr:hypothetical protein [Romeriopsis navalis]MBE9031829.1 hypothetical protein [Romeriopsis navalis LEGE 11480]
MPNPKDQLTAEQLIERLEQLPTNELIGLHGRFMKLAIVSMEAKLSESKS